MTITNSFTPSFFSVNNFSPCFISFPNFLAVFSSNIAIIYSAIYGKYNTNVNGHTATCKLATNIDIIINASPYLFCFVSINFSIANICNMNNINVTNYPLAVI